MALGIIRHNIESYYRKNSITEVQNNVFQIFDLANNAMINIMVEMARAPLVDMTNMTFTLYDWPVIMENDNITVWAALLATFHNSAPDYDAYTVEVLKAKESSLYSDEDIAEQLRREWNEKLKFF